MRDQLCTPRTLPRSPAAVKGNDSNKGQMLIHPVQRTLYTAISIPLRESSCFFRRKTTFFPTYVIQDGSITNITQRLYTYLVGTRFNTRLFYLYIINIFGLHLMLLVIGILEKRLLFLLSFFKEKFPSTLSIQGNLIITIL